MDEIKTTRGIVRLIRNGEVMAEKEFSHKSRSENKNAIIQAWKYLYGKKFFECEVHVINLPIKEKVYIKVAAYRERLRKRIPVYVISGISTFKTEELEMLKELVDSELTTRAKVVSIKNMPVNQNNPILATTLR